MRSKYCAQKSGSQSSEPEDTKERFHSTAAFTDCPQTRSLVTRHPLSFLPSVPALASSGGHNKLHTPGGPAAEIYFLAAPEPGVQVKVLAGLASLETSHLGLQTPPLPCVLT